jgi:elongation factor Ts
MAVSIQQIKELRERTSAGMGDCKSALNEADGDMDKAVEIILKKGKAKSAKRAGKTAAEGVVRCEVTADGQSGVIAEVNIETDFSARNDKFAAFVDKAVSAAKAADGTTPFGELQIEGKSLDDHASDLTAVIGEKITLRRYGKLGIDEGKHGFVHSYVHMGGKIGVLVAIEAETAAAAAHDATKSFADETSMQIAAMNPLVLKRDQLDPAEVAKQKDIFEGQLREEAKPKPEAVWPKIVEGKLEAWYKEVCLLDQVSAQHKKPIDELRKETGKTAGAGIAITAFLRNELGEGIEKKSEDLAAGVAELLDN